MAYRTGNGVILIRSEMLLDLVFNGKKVQATWDDSEMVYFENITNHSVGANGSHEFDCVMFRNGLAPYQAKVKVKRISTDHTE